MGQYQKQEINHDGQQFPGGIRLAPSFVRSQGNVTENIRIVDPKHLRLFIKDHWQKSADIIVKPRESLGCTT